MYEAITVFRTIDGKQHKTPDHAERYVKETIEAAICKIVTSAIRESKLSQGLKMTAAIPLTDAVYKCRGELFKIFELEFNDLSNELED